MAHRLELGGVPAPVLTAGSAIADQAVSPGMADRDELRRLADGWRAWATEPDAWFNVVHGEILAKP
ncbi:MAG: hypothetical protein ACRC35_09740 [Angustibacter sp.]